VLTTENDVLRKSQLAGLRSRAEPSTPGPVMTLKRASRPLDRRTSSGRPREVASREINRSVESMLWGRAAGRCEFEGCNRELYKSRVTQEPVNIAQKAHIYAFSAAGPRGNRGVERRSLNNIENLMLVCGDCHINIDKKWTLKRYTAPMLQKWKRAHEQRIARVTEIGPDKRSHILLFHANIGNHRAPLHYRQAADAVFPYRYPAEDHAFEFGCGNSPLSEETESLFWEAESQSLDDHYAAVRRRIDRGDVTHLSVFAIAPQPLLIRLGTLLGDIVPTDVYQLHREPRSTWKWPVRTKTTSAFEIRRPASTTGPPALVLALSATITADRITAVLGPEAAIWTVTVPVPHKEIVKSPDQLSEIRALLRQLFDEIKAAHGQTALLHVFPAMPVSLAVEFGRARSPKADMPWRIYDQVNTLGGFVPALEIYTTGATLNAD